MEFVIRKPVMDPHTKLASMKIFVPNRLLATSRLLPRSVPQPARRSIIQSVAIPPASPTPIPRIHYVNDMLTEYLACSYQLECMTHLSQVHLYYVQRIFSSVRCCFPLDAYGRSCINTLHHLLKNTPRGDILIHVDASHHSTGSDAGIAIVFINKTTGLCLAAVTVSYSNVPTSNEAEGIGLKLAAMLCHILNLKTCKIQNDNEMEVARADKYITSTTFEWISRSYNFADIYTKWAYKHPPRVLNTIDHGDPCDIEL